MHTLVSQGYEKKCAIIYSGGKDSHLALLETIRNGKAVACLVCFDGWKRHAEYFNDSNKTEMIKAHADLLNVPLVLVKTGSGSGFRIKDISGNVSRLAAAAEKK